MNGKIRTGIGGWTYKPWRGSFYPKGLRQADELNYAGEHLGAIEINGTYYRLQKPESFAKWRDAVPDGFEFSIKASRYCTNRKDLRETEESIGRFMDQGLVELGDKLGPLFWQFMPTKKFDPEEFRGFLQLLPIKLEGMELQHALEVRHESFLCPEFIELARKYNAAVVCTHSGKYPQIDEQTADFSYARLMCSKDEIETGYTEDDLDRWADTAKGWSKGGRGAYLFFIGGAKVRAPAAAQALMQRI